MLSQRLAIAARPIIYRRAIPVTSMAAQRAFRISFPRGPTTAPLDPEYYPENDPAKDPGMNGGYVNPPFEKRQFRDPYGEWWDKQERRNYGEIAHEDEDLLCRFSPEVYTWIDGPGTGLRQIGLFVATVLGFCGVVYQFYPDKPAVPREFPAGFDKYCPPLPRGQ